MCWDIFILLLLPPTLPSQQIPSQRCWFLSCDHYGNLASFLLLIYDLVNMPACQMVLFFRLGDNEINKNCCKKQIGEFFVFFFRFFFFSLNGLLFISTNVLGRPLPQLTVIPSRWTELSGTPVAPEKWVIYSVPGILSERDRVSASPAPQSVPRVSAAAWPFPSSVCLALTRNALSLFIFLYLLLGELPGARDRDFFPLNPECLA